jgi:hypothetical protein
MYDYLMVNLDGTSSVKFQAINDGQARAESKGLARRQLYWTRFRLTNLDTGKLVGEYVRYPDMTYKRVQR